MTRWAKLRTMSAVELGSRVRYAAFTTWERTAHRRGRLLVPRLERDSLRQELRSSTEGVSALLERQRRAQPFLASLDDPSGLRRVFSTHFDSEHVASRRIAEAVRRHELAFFGETFRFGARIPWHDDPRTGTTWPKLYHRDVPIHGGDIGFGDVKYVWEVNRHQFFVDMAKVALLDDDRECGQEVDALHRDWMDEVPYATGVPWASALEPAFRVWSWVWTYDMLRQAGHLDDSAYERWLTGFHAHGRFLLNHVETYSSPYNHLIGEAAALYALGLLFPEFRDADRWHRRGHDLLERALPSQFHSDGGTVEQSTFYHHATLGSYLLALAVGRRRGDTFSGRTLRAVERGLEFSMALMLPDGRMPAIGGADDGKPIRFEHVPLWDFRSYLAIGAVMFSRPDFKCAAGRFWEDALWLLGADGFAAFDALSPKSPRATVLLPQSGYAVSRSAWSAQADYLCFDCGPQAAGLDRGGVPSAVHGHADCLEVIVALGGRQVLVDPGFYCYNGDPDWESHFRKTVAHNTAVIDRKDQARHRGKMDWTHTFEPSIDGWEEATDVAWARGSHDGYAREPDGITHRRAAWLRTGGYVIVYDEFDGAGEHDITVNFQWAPGELSLDPNEPTALFDDRFELGWIASSPVRVSFACGGRGPSDGWVAESLGVLRSAPRMELELELRDGRATLLTILTDRQLCNGLPRVSGRRADTRSVLSLCVHGPGWEDWVIASDETPASTGRLETDAALGVVRIADGVVRHTHRIGGTYLRVVESLQSASDQGQPEARVDTERLNA